MTNTTNNPSPDWHRTRCYATALRRANRAMHRRYDAALRPTGLSCTQLSLLRLIQRAPGDVTYSDLADAQVMERTTLSRNLTTLGKAGYVETSAGEDRRVRYVRLTEAGENIIEQALPAWEETQRQLESDRGYERMQQLLAELDELCSTLSMESGESA